MPANGSTTRASNIDISLPINRPAANGTWTPEIDAKIRAKEASSIHLKSPNAIAPEFYRHGKRSLSGIAVRAFGLGSTAVLGLTSAILLAYLESRLWRPFLFLATLSVFHFLEFYVTAAYNTPIAFVESFLLSNGNQYRIAHSLSFIETCITSFLFPAWQERVHKPIFIAVGVGLIVLGQVVRSTAMAQAGTNFNHMVQSRKNEGHELVTSGLYAYFRHPSYFGFFWWGVGTQIMLGNTVCSIGYAGVLWYFFSRRIRHEEQHLIEFFGDEYRAYRAKTRVWIPFI